VFLPLCFSSRCPADIKYFAIINHIAQFDVTGAGFALCIHGLASQNFRIKITTAKNIVPEKWWVPFVLVECSLTMGLARSRARRAG
jgi:hypothetical protein